MRTCKGLGAGRSIWIALLGAALIVSAIAPAFSASITFVKADFEGVHGIPPSWQVALGTWQADGHTYDSTVAVPAAVTTIFEYPFPPEDGPTVIYDRVPVGDYAVVATLRNQRGTANSLIGLVYAYFDPANYREVAFSPNGTAYLRIMHGGQLDVIAAASYPLLTATEALQVVLELESTGTSVRVNGVPVFTQAKVFSNTGQVGLSTYNTTARFDDVFISTPVGQQPVTEDFSDGFADGFFAPQGTFIVSNGVYVDTAVRQTDLSVAPVDFSNLREGIILNYTLHVRMLNPYGGAGNLVGIKFDQDFRSPAYQELVFSPTGVAQIRRVDGDNIQVLDSAPADVVRNKWFTVTMVVGGFKGAAVSVDGKPVFEKLTPLLATIPNDLALITHWTPGRFDDFRFGFDQPVIAAGQNFDGALPTSSVRSGTWNTQGGTLNDASAGIADIVIPENFTGETDYRYNGRLLNQYSASGNLVGLVFGYRSQGDYVEAVFAPTGQAYLQQYLEGKRYRLATATHAIPPNVWFDVEVLQKGPATTVSLNGAPLFQSIQLGNFAGGAFGVVSHWSKARFDNLSVQEAP